MKLWAQQKKWSGHGRTGRTADYGLAYIGFKISWNFVRHSAGLFLLWEVILLYWPMGLRNTSIDWLFPRGCSIQARCDGPSLLFSQISHRLLCACVWSSRSPATTICQASSTVCSTCAPQHVWKPCGFYWCWTSPTVWNQACGQRLWLRYLCAKLAKTSRRVNQPWT